MSDERPQQMHALYSQMGVVEAIKASLSALPQQSITLCYLLSGLGDITLSDIDLALHSMSE